MAKSAKNVAAAIRSSSTAGGSSGSTTGVLQEHSRSGTEVGTPPSDALEAAVASNALGLLRTLSALQAAVAKLVQVSAPNSRIASIHCPGFAQSRLSQP